MNDVKQIKLVWPKKLWLALSKKAEKQKTSLQTLITEAVLDRYGIEHWRKGTNKQIEDILTKCDYVPQDIKECIDNILVKRQQDKLIPIETLLEDGENEQWQS